MRISTRIFILFFIVCPFIFFFSCRKERKSPSWDTDILAPLVKSTLTINNIIPDSVLTHNADNSLKIVYNKTLFSFSTISIPDTTIDTVYMYPFPVYVDSCDVILPEIIQENVIKTGAAQLTTARIHAGIMRVELKNKTRKIVDVNYQIPGATKNSVPFNQIISVPAETGSVPGTVSTDFDMSGYSLNLTGLNGGKYNTIYTKVSAKVNCNDFAKDTIFGGDYISVSNGILGLIPEYAKGYFVESDTALVGSSDLSLFNHIIGGALHLADLDLGFDITNGMGVDIQFLINNLSSINSRTGIPVALTHTIIGTPININRAVDNNGNVTSSSYSVSINPGNSNVKQFVENLPDKLSYNMAMEINPLGGTISGGNDFYYYKAPMNVNMDISIPLSLVANDLTMTDTVNFKLNSNADNVNYGTLYLYASNGFPFTAAAQLYLMDEHLAIVDSLFSSADIIQAPPLDGNFICVGQQMSKLTIPVDAKKMDLLRSVRKMVVKIKFNTTNQPNYIKIYSFYKMDVSLVGDFNYAVGK